MKNFFSSYKTTISAILVLALVGVYIFDLIEVQAFNQLLAVLIAMGFITAADADRIRKP